MRRLATLMAILGLGLVACADDDDTEAAGPTVTTTATTVATTGATSTTVAPTLECLTVGFTPNSEDAASDVRATGLTCADAEAFVAVAGRQTSSGGPAEVDVEGYRCVRTRSEQDPLPRSFYECTSGSRTVTFVRS